MVDQPIDYYATLDVSPTATAEEIRTAYKKAALKWHPDRVPADSPERTTRTKKFQQINDAYFTLSDATRRRDYDAVRQWSSSSADDTSTTSDPADEGAEEIPRPPPQSKQGGGWGSWFFGSGSDKGPSSDYGERQWSSAFEEMMRDTDLGEEGDGDGGHKQTKPTSRFWTIVGTASGAALGFIVGDFVGGAAGAGFGGKLGAVRDTHQKSVYKVFQELPQADKARILSELATKLFAQALSG